MLFDIECLNQNLIITELLKYPINIQHQAIHELTSHKLLFYITYMLQGIVERILQKILGEYLDGFNSKNLNIGIWSGEVVIQNVRLKKSALIKLGLPIELKYSIIQNMMLKIPWKSLTSSKTQLYLDGVYIVLDKVPEAKWELKDERIIEKRKKEINEYAEAMLKMFLENQKKQENKKQQQGFTERIILRIIDNLQVEIKNIHIRLQQPNYCSGATLENFKLTTVNKLGVPEYINRSKPEYKNQPLRKKLEMKNFGVYSNLRDASIFKGQETYKEMARLVGKDKGLKYLILLNFESKLIQMPKGQVEEPELKLNIGIKKLEIEFQNQQIQQLIYFSQNIQKYQRLLKKNNSKQLFKQEKEAHVKQFSEIFDKYYNRGQVFEGDQQKRYENILSGMNAEQFYPAIKKIIQSSQIKKALEEKQTKKIGWFSYGKKDLTEEQTKEVEEFIINNFSQQVKIYKRPVDYGYIQVNILLNQATIFVGKRERNFFEGVVLRIVELEVDIKKRSKGLDVGVALTNMSIDLVENSFIDQQTQYTNFFRKQSDDEKMKYISLIFSTSPPDQPYLDVKASGVIQPSVIYYTPAFVKRISQFINLKISDQNTDKALEKMNEIKDKTTQAIDESINTKKDITIIGVDMTINAPLIIIPFIKEYDKYCWGINMGQLKFQTDKSLINSTMDKNNVQTQRYLLKLQNLNSGWYSNKDLLLKQYSRNHFTMKHQMVLKNFGFDLVLELSKKKSLDSANISIKGQLPNFLLNISDFTYKRLLHLTEATPKNEKKATQTLVAHNIGGKEEIIKLSEKKDIVYYHSPRTKLWSKYIAVLKGNYIYLFESKNSETYDSYIYVKNSKVEIQDPVKCGRSFTIRIKNKVSDDTISLLKQQNMKIWIDLIAAKKTEEQIQKQKLQITKSTTNKANPNKLKLHLFLSISSFGVKFFNDGKQWMDIRLHTLMAQVQMYEHRKQIHISLKGLTLDDTVEHYLNLESDYLIKSGYKNGQFVDIWVHQKDEEDPGYKDIINEVEVSIGMLWVNLKPKVNKRLLEFFTPEKDEQEKLDESNHSISTQATLHHQESYVDNKQNKLLVKLKFAVEEISLCLINSATKIRLSTISIKKLELNMTQSSSILILKGVLADLNVTQQTNYPNTIVSQSEKTQITYLVKTHNISHKQLLSIEIQILKGKNKDGKQILVDLTIKQLMINYFQQPILRIIDFLTLDFLPSLKKQNSVQKAKSFQSAKLVAPQPSAIDIKVNVLNSIVMLRTTPSHNDGIKLLISNVEVKNVGGWSSDYSIEKVLIEDYVISIRDVSILRQLKQITNNFNIDLKVHLIQNSDYYKSNFKSFKPIMKIECQLSSFLARINNVGFNFMMKILNHNISYNDNCDQFYFPFKIQQEQEREKNKEKTDPILFQMGIQALTLVVAEEILPTSNLGIKDLKVEFSSTNLESLVFVTINDISGSYFQEKGGKLILRPMINTSKVIQEISYEKESLVELKDLVKLFHNVTDSVNPVNDLVLKLNMKPSGQKAVDIKLQSLYIDLKLRPLLKLSRIANIESDTQAPPPKYPPLVIKTAQAKSSQFNFWLSINNVKIRGGSDQARNEAILISIDYIGVNMVSPPEMTPKEVLSIKKKDPQEVIMASKLQLKINELQISLVETFGFKEKKRVLLKPASIAFFKKGIYYAVGEKCMLSDDLQVLISGIIFEVTTRDLLKLHALYSNNMAILTEQNKEQERVKQKQKQQELQKSKTKQKQHQKQEQGSKSSTKIEAIMNKQQMIKQLKGNIQIRCFNLKVLHHSQDLVLPVLMLDLHEVCPIYRSNMLVDQFSLVVHIAFDYFNPRSSQWEPIFERMGIHIEHIVTHKDIGDQSLLIVENVDETGMDQFNINISSQFLTSLSQIISLNKKQKEKIEKNLQNNQKVEVSPFVLQNMTLSEIQVFTIEEDFNIKQLEKNLVVTIKPREKKPIVVPLQSTQLKIRINQKQHTINIASIGKRMIPDSQFLVDCQVQKLFKVIIIMSHIIIENKTTKPLFIKADNQQPILIESNGHISFKNSRQLSFGHQKEGMSKFVKIQDMFIKNSINFKGERLYLNVSKEEIVIEGKKISKFVVQAPIKLMNLMPYPMLYQVLINGQTKATKSLDSMKEYEIFRHKRGAQMELKINVQGFYWSRSIDLSKLNKGGSKLEKIQLRDQDFNETLVNTFIQIDSITESMEIIFFPSGYIVNDTPFDLVCFGEFQHGKKNKAFIPLAGQQEIQSGSKIDSSTIIFGPDLGKKIKFAHKQSPDQPSSEIEVAGIGDTEFEVLVKQTINEELVDTYVVCVVDRSLKTMMKTTAIQKQIRITPKHIIENKTQRTLYISQQSNKQFELKSGQRKIFYFFSKGSRKVRIRTKDSQTSADLDVDSFGIVNFYINIKQKVKMNLKMNVCSVDDYSYIAFSPLLQKQIPYRIRNNIKDLEVKATIIDGSVQYGQEVAFLWKDPAAKHTFQLALKHKKGGETQRIQVNPDEVSVSTRKTLKLQGQLLNIRIHIDMKQDMKVVTIDEDDKAQSQQESRILSSLNISLKKIGISLIMNHSKIQKPYQALFISFHQLQFIKETTLIDETYQARMRFFQIDQNYPHLMAYPVVMTPSKFKHYMIKKQSEEERYIINILVKKDTRIQNSTVLKTILFEIDNISIRISELFIRMLLEVFSEFKEVMALHFDQSVIVRKKDDWLKFQVPADSKPVFIQEIIISPFQLQISLRLKEQNSDKSKMKLPFENLISAFGINFIDIDEAPIFLNGIVIKNCFDSVDGIKSKIIQNYKWAVLRQFYKLIGSIAILGNPIGLFKNISTGLSDMVEKPASGLVKGPLELGRGIAEGGYSLVAHTLGGALSSLDKMTGALSTGLAFLCLDPQFEEKRQKQKNKKPKNVLQGLQKGAKAVFSGFKEGITGIFLKPYENATKDGFLGFLKGTYQGLSGAVIKPITGILDFASKTTQGLKNTVMFFQDKPNESRMRCPRPFYGQNSLLKEYNIVDAEIMNVLQFVRKAKFAQCKFINVFMIEKPEEQSLEALVIVDTYIINLSFQKKEVHWYIEMNNIVSCIKDQTSVTVYLKKSSKFFENTEVQIKHLKPEQVKLIYNSIEERLEKINNYISI